MSTSRVEMISVSIYRGDFKDPLLRIAPLLRHFASFGEQRLPRKRDVELMASQSVTIDAPTQCDSTTHGRGHTDINFRNIAHSGLGSFDLHIFKGSIKHLMVFLFTRGSQYRHIPISVIAAGDHGSTLECIAT